MTNKYGASTDELFDFLNIVMDKDGFILMPTSNHRYVHIRRITNLPYEPLCGTHNDDLHYTIDMSQVKTHPRICPECAAHPDVPLMLLGDL